MGGFKLDEHLAGLQFPPIENLLSPKDRELLALRKLRRAVEYNFGDTCPEFLLPCRTMHSNHRTDQCVGCSLDEIDRVSPSAPKEKAPARPDWDSVWMDLASSLSKRSTCSRLKVGCVVVTEDNQRVLGIGYNGGPRGISNECLSLEPGLCGHLHAEVNALIKADYTTPVPKKMFVTTQPCYHCAVAIVNASITEVVYRDSYRQTDGLELLQKAGIKVRQLHT